MERRRFTSVCRQDRVMKVLDGQHVDPAGIELVDVVIQLERVAAEDGGLVVQKDDPPGGESICEIPAPRVDRVDALSGNVTPAYEAAASGYAVA